MNRICMDESYIKSLCPITDIQVVLKDAEVTENAEEINFNDEIKIVVSK